ncbi:Retrovirus-related Pol polyprotein from type-2 retrotransposable element R2DM-like Protein [Caligus rogercresseyi]|uniref:Retrovirus-related Pol polyprotein from type-2 retrotransposable element R2DM-like Protein n=1 Tax=Caligus rogercresseyi TaxID=217165 RepID=A0A7T8JZZ1_CALRO|nr:Retrovirus-related Pol polyprotein from type-2 retrotransposable element R2DM-like Protein [Caligus rogercresseyi]
MFPITEEEVKKALPKEDANTDPLGMDAFDSVSHKSVRWACMRLGIPDPLINYFQQVLGAATTAIGRNAPVSINSGVLQGDPLSSLLFNFVLDGVLEEALDRQGPQQDRYELDGTPASALLYADDAVLLSRSEAGLQAFLDAFNEAAGKVGLKLNPSKCRYFAAGRGSRSARSCLKLADTTLSPMSPEDTQKYLGLLYSPEGVRMGNITAALRKGVANIYATNISLQHKYWCLRDFLLPRFVYELSLGRVGTRDIETADHLVREFMRSLGRLPRCTPVEFFHAPTSMGGLGLMQFRSKIVCAKNGAAKAAANSSDPLVKAAVKCDPLS